jgi:hypothetical protein
MKKDATRTGDWFVTYTGLKFWPFDPTPDDIVIEDIAHALSQICRFGGHTSQFFSVAQHSVLVSEIVPPALALQGLLHDATEAYCGDMVRPLKVGLPSYEAVEDKIWQAIAKRYDLPVKLSKVIKWADNTLLMTERRDILRHVEHKWSLELEGYKPLPDRIEPLSPEASETLFFNCFTKLYA